MHLKRGLVRTKEGRWYHCSPAPRTVKLRALDDGARDETFKLPEERDRLQEFLQNAEVVSLGQIRARLATASEFPPAGHKAEDRQAWRDVASLLSEENDESVSPEALDKSPAHPIPVTRLRRFYESLRLINTIGVHGRIAGYLAGSSEEARTDSIDTLFRDSLAHLHRYKNDQPFQERAQPDWFGTYRDDPQQFAKCFVARLAPQSGKRSSMQVEGDPALEYRVADYEISPLRSANGWMFEDGRPGRSSGAGGMDLLLATHDRVPVVGEIKAPGDTSVFLALIQALMYASELVTPHQQKRLAKHYPTVFKTQNPPCCEITVCWQCNDQPQLLGEAKGIIDGLMKNPDGAVAAHVRRISLVKARLREDGASSVHLAATRHSCRFPSST